MSGPLRLVQISDLHFHHEPADFIGFSLDTDATFDQVAELIEPLRPDVIIATGDLAQDPVPAVYQRLHDRLRRLPAPVHCLPGNHDDPALLAERFGALPRQVLLADWQLLLLDSFDAEQSPGGRLGEAALAWLDRTLSANPDRHALLALHHHPLPIHSRWLDGMALADHHALLDLLHGHSQVRGVIFGHIHQDFHVRRQDIDYFGTPSTCLQFKPRTEEFARDERPPGLRCLDLHADGGIESRVIYV